ncbi:MAG: peptide/nickel transport system substrate-binding protein [Trebonia sp.]|nr:peptide/nickel transport system substrate-binding protein [Trebonia sp.]
MSDGVTSGMTPAFSRRRLLQVGGAGLLAVGAGPLLAACGTSSSGGTAAGSTTLTVGVYQEPDSLDPAATGLAMVSMMITHIFDPLVWWLPTSSGQNEFYPGLAMSYEVSPDGTEYTFKLRQDVDFHDGTHFDASAVQANFEHIVNPATQSRAAIGALGPYKETVVIDQYTAKVVFTQPNASFVHEMTDITFGMQSPAAIKKYGAQGVANHPTGTGPFKFVEYVTQNHVTVTKNPTYKWGPAPFGSPSPAKLDEIEFKILSDSNARYNALVGGQIQMAMNLEPDSIASIKANSAYVHYNVPSTGQPYGYPINVDKGSTSDIRVRQAILHAVNQEQLNTEVQRGVYTAAYNVLTPTTPGYVAANDKMYPYDPAKAMSLLDAAGWQAGSGGIRVKDGQQLSLDILIQSDNGFDLPTAYVVNALKQVGFASTTSDQPFTTAAASYNKGVQNFSAIFYYDVDPYLLHNLYESSQIQTGFNWSHYDNPALDAAINKANTITGTAQRTAAYQKITTTLMEAAIFLPLWNVSGVYSGTKSLKNVHFGPTGYSYYHTAYLA